MQPTKQDELNKAAVLASGVRTPYVGQTPNITTDAIKPSTPIDLANSVVTPTDTGAGVVSGAEAGANQFKTDYDNYMKSVAEEKKSDSQNSVEDLIKSITGDLGGLTGRGAEQAKQEQTRGVNRLSQEEADVNAQILTKTAEYNKLNADIEAGAGRKGITTSAVMGQQGAVNRQAASEIGLLQARQLGLQGQLKAAQDAANRAVDLMFQDREAVVNTKLKQLELINPLFTAEEKKRSDARTYALNKEKDKLAEEKQNKKDIEKMLVDATPVAPADVIARATEVKNRGGSTSEVAKALGVYGGDYYKTELLKEQIKKEKAETAKINAETPNGNNGYTKNQLASITKLNQDVSKNATYAKTTAMRGYSDNVTASLSQNTGVGDIAAINQFQKVIDEGAVTRDQDVKLIQSAQSLSNTLKTKLKKLEKGEQLSPELRQQMRKTVEDLYTAQIKALNKDPYIQAKTKEAELYQVKPEDTILGELSGFTSTSPADNKFGQAIGVTPPATYSTAGMSVNSDGTLTFTLPTNKK